MALGPSEYLLDSWLDALGNATAFSVTTVYAQLHDGDPGAAGTANTVTETGREIVSFAASSGGVMANDAEVQWTSIAGSEDATHFSLWDASTVGNFLGSGTITANAYTAGDDYTAAIGAFEIDMSAGLAA